MLDTLRKLPEYQECLDAIKLGRQPATLGLIRSARLPVLAALCTDLNVPILLLTDRSDRAALMFDELSFWLPDVPRVYFPEPTPMFYENAAWGSLTRRDRLQAFSTLVQYFKPGSKKPDTPCVVVAPLRAVMTRTLPRREFILASKTLRLGSQQNPELLRREFVRLGYENTDVVVEHGQFSRRGGILDVWPPAEPFPARLEFFGDELDTLRYFDPASQRTVRALELIEVTPAREFILPDKPGESVDGKEPDEFLIPVFHPNAATILDYLPANALILVDSFSNIQEFGEEIEEQALKNRADNVREGILPEEFPNPYLSWSDLVETVTNRRWMEMVRPFGEEGENLGSKFLPGMRFAGQIKHFVTYLENCCKAGDKTVIVSRQVPRLKEIWGEMKATCDPNNQPRFVEATLGEGWDLLLENDQVLHCITDGEIFGWERPAPRARLQVKHIPPESDFADLKIGDWVVHVDYGIGRFSGLVRRFLDGMEKEFLLVEYEGGDQVFVPIHQADRLNRYIGTGGEPPQPSRLGSNEWSQTKQSVREAIIQVAQDLLELYAKRQTAVGYAFGPDTAWQQDLEASFPYVETDDQLKAIRDVKLDMEDNKPMDRLLCGDVGYGKTEVALRAAFKAVMDGKQVAVLVPTTVLAQQHYETFRQRLLPFPVKVEMLSRFKTPKEQDDIVLRTLLGEVDIVIGTHRLLTGDVAFKDLGLVIIDEEQRFGVTHKEHFKKLRTEVDVLTLTATPIPRTLYMALTGARDISMINTPPAERLPIITHIGPYSPKIVRQAILRELDRGGQVFFVHNRVQTIEAMRQHLNNLVPEARVAIGHGQMREDELSQVMTRFTKGEVDVLLCTSIIESGLDIPNANTLIVDRGDAFGLAQLYQLRGRVGRGGQRAFAYFFKHRKKAPTPEGQERLDTIAENMQLGAGYSIAMRDLEMRGAGEMLGTRQSGYIASVGFHLYTRMLTQAVRQLRRAAGEKVENEEDGIKTSGYLPVSVDLPLSVGIPVDYIPDQSLRLQLYRRMANIEDLAELDQLQEEFTDRFGPPVEQVKDLFFQLRVKLQAGKAGLVSVSAEGDQIVLRFPPLPNGVSARELPPIGLQTRSGRNAYWMKFSTDDDTWRIKLLNVLDVIISA
ncbi:MAG: transcription-repair coupling factor [Anaerolineaceae bacterium]|jgi:transcription-repair coupling factor (superfamily II helicase)